MAGSRLTPGQTSVESTRNTLLHCLEHVEDHDHANFLDLVDSLAWSAVGDLDGEGHDGEEDLKDGSHCCWHGSSSCSGLDHWREAWLAARCL